MEGISKKIYLRLSPPTEEENRSCQRRILDALMERGIRAKLPLSVMRRLYPLCDGAGYQVTVSLAWDGDGWEIVDLEAGDASARHFGLAADLGSTTVAVRLFNCNSGKCLGEASCYNRQIAFGTDILTRIFYCKDNPERLEEVRRATVESLADCMEELRRSTGIAPDECISMAVAGNTTMMHFLLGLDAFCVFYTPHALRADCPGFLPARELGVPVKGYVYGFPSKSNYLGGDILSGVLATGLYREREICAFFDIGTNGELVIGNREFLLCGAGAAGPALEGGVVKTGMRASPGAVDAVELADGEIRAHVIAESMGTDRCRDLPKNGLPDFSAESVGNAQPCGLADTDAEKFAEGGSSTAAKGICGSGIVDLLAQMFLCGWVDIRGQLVPEKSPRIRKYGERYGVEYAPGLVFYQEDIDEFIRTKAAASTMVEIMLRESGISMEELSKFYVAGAFGKHVSKESAIAIGMYPDMERDKIINAGNSSLEGAGMLLLDRGLLADIEEILEKMVYIQFAAVEDFLELMTAARALPHTDFGRYPTVMEKLKKYRVHPGQEDNRANLDLEKQADDNGAAGRHDKK